MPTVPAQDIRNCRIEKVIPQKIQTEITNAKCDYDAASCALPAHDSSVLCVESAKKLL